jgi:hypothetical protein
VCCSSRLLALSGKLTTRGLMPASLPCLCIPWPKGGTFPGVLPPSGGFSYLTFAGARRRQISKWFVPGGVEMAGEVGSASARREPRATSSWTSAFLAP